MDDNYSYNCFILRQWQAHLGAVKSSCKAVRFLIIGTKKSSKTAHEFARFLFTAFVLQRGRVALRLDTEDVRCRTVSFTNGSFESSRGSVRIQTTINYFNYSGNFIHDAAVTWVEKVTLNSFDEILVARCLSFWKNLLIYSFKIYLGTSKAGRNNKP